MREFLVSSIYKGTNIDKENKIWSKLSKVAAEEDSDILFDFKGLILEEPCSNTEFLAFMRNEHVYMKIYTDEKCKDTIETCLLLGRMKTGRVINEDLIRKKRPSYEDIRRENDINRFYGVIKNELVDGEEAAILEGKDMTVIGVLDEEMPLQSVIDERIVDIIHGAMKKWLEANKDIKYFFLDFNNLEIAEFLVKKIVSIGSTFESSGVSLSISSDDKKTDDMLSICQKIDISTHISSATRAKIIINTIERGTVGMLSMYKMTKKHDMLGRMGDGIPIMTRPAIYVGIKYDKEKRKYIVRFRTFKCDTFCRKNDYRLDNDGKELEELEEQIIDVDIESLGFKDRYIGERYHFNMPIQYKEDDMKTIYHLKDNNGELEISTTEVTLPVYIRLVLLDFGIKFNDKQLLNDIMITDMVLNKLRNSREGQ